MVSVSLALSRSSAASPESVVIRSVTLDAVLPPSSRTSFSLIFRAELPERMMEPAVKSPAALTSFTFRFPLTFTLPVTDVAVTSLEMISITFSPPPPVIAPREILSLPSPVTVAVIFKTPSIPLATSSLSELLLQLMVMVASMEPEIFPCTFREPVGYPSSPTGMLPA